jgi:hypothetical protein
MSVIEGDFAGRIPGIPEPPEDLTEAQGEIWRAVIATEPPGYFDTAARQAMLADYCTRREAANTLSLVIAGFKSEWLRSEGGSKRYQRLAKMRDLEMRAVSALATKLRLTNQARLSPKVAGTRARNFSPQTKPWDL